MAVNQREGRWDPSGGNRPKTARTASPVLGRSEKKEMND